MTSLPSIRALSGAPVSSGADRETYGPSRIGPAVHVAVRELPACLQRALKSVSYGAADVEVMTAETIEAASYSGEGQRAFTLIVNLDTGASHTSTGSWGGSNPFTSTRADDSREYLPVLENGAVIKGSRGYPRTFASIYVHPSRMALLLPSGDETELTGAQQQCLYCFAAIKGGEYRRDEMRRRNVSPADVDSLVSSGHLKRNKAGAVQITTKGKNARTVKS